MTHKKTFILYGLVLFLSIGLFGYALFPKDKIKQHLIAMFENHYPGTTLDVQDIGVSLPAGIKLIEPRISFDESNRYEAHKLIVGYRLFSFFGDDHAYALNANAYDGNIKGTIGVSKKNPQQMSADLDVTDLQAGAIKLLSDMSKHQFAGILNGDITYEKTPANQHGSLSLQITECKIPLMVSFINLGVLDFNDIQMEAKLTNKNLGITSCILKGPQVDGDISGSITLSDVFEQSRLNLTGTLKPHPDFIATLPQNIIPRNLIGPNGINFKIMGTLENPNFALR